MLYLLACQGAPGDVGAGVGTGGGAEHEGVVLNEIVARNQSTWDDGSYTFPDWIEVYNGGAAPIDLAEIALSGGGGDAWVGGAGTLEIGAHLLIPAGTSGGAPFSLAAEGGEVLELWVAGAVVDRIVVAASAPDVALARFPDGGAWAETTRATPGGSNGATASPTLDPTDDVFQVGRILEIALELDEGGADSLRVDRFVDVTGAVTLDGMRYAPISVHLKSTGGSRREFDQKPGFKIDLNQLAGFHWKGLANLTLNNLVQDKSYVHEHLTYTLYRAAGVPAPRVAWAHLTVDAMDYGLYLLVESADGAFLSRWYADPEGPLFEATFGVDVVAGYDVAFDNDGGSDDRSGLTQLINAVAMPPNAAGADALDAILDLEQVRRTLALGVASMHWDGYVNTNNYRLYQDPTTGRFDLLPWGADETWDRQPLHPWASRGVLLPRCLADPACAMGYDEELRAAADQVERLDLAGLARAIAAGLRPAIEADARREFDMRTHDAMLEHTVQQIEAWPPVLRGLLP